MPESGPSSVERRDHVIVGFGASVYGALLPMIDAAGKLRTFLRKAPLFLDAGSDNPRTSFDDFHIMANSRARSFLPISIGPLGVGVHNDSSGLHLKHFNRGKPHRKAHLSRDVAPAMRMMKQTVRGEIDRSPADLRFNTRVTALRVADNHFQLYGPDGEPIVSARKLLLANGVSEVEHPELKRMCGDKLVLSSDIIQGDFSRIRRAGPGAKKIVIVGSSHATAAILDQMSRRGMNRPVTVVAKSIHIHEGEADTQFKGVKLAKGRMKQLRDGRGKDEVIWIESDLTEVSPEVFDEADLVIQAIGHQANCPVSLSSGEPYFDMDGGTVQVNRLGSGLIKNGKIMPRAWGLGIGYAPISPDGQREVAVDVFRTQASRFFQAFIR